MYLISIDKAKLTRSVTIRDGTKYEEVIGVRREWVYPWRFDLASAYYDIAVMELGKRPVLLLHHIGFMTFQCYILRVLV